MNNEAGLREADQDVSIAVTDRGGNGPAVILLHGLAGSSRELLHTADALRDSFRVLLVDQRGHGGSTRRPADLSREAFVKDVVHVIEELLPGQRCALVGQSMGAHTAFLVASTRPDLVSSLVMLEGHVAGSAHPEAAATVGHFFASWPVPFTDETAARAYLGDDPIVNAWIGDFEVAPDGLRPRFDADIMERSLEAVHVPRWKEWEDLTVPTLTVFAKDSMFSREEQDELIRRRPTTERINLSGGSHDAHLDAFDEWVDVLRRWLLERPCSERAVNAR